MHFAINILSIIFILLINSPIVIVLVPILHITPNESKRDFHYHHLQNLNNNKPNITIEIVDNGAKTSVLEDIKSQSGVDVDVGVKYNVRALLRRLMMREPNVKREEKKKKCPKAKKKGKVNRITSKEYKDFVTKLEESGEWNGR